METLFLGLGLVLIIEGLVLALAPSRLEDLVAMLRQLGPQALRLLGFAAITFGLIFLWISRQYGI